MRSRDFQDHLNRHEKAVSHDRHGTFFQRKLDSNSTCLFELRIVSFRHLRCGYPLHCFSGQSVSVCEHASSLCTTRYVSAQLEALSAAPCGHVIVRLSYRHSQHNKSCHTPLFPLFLRPCGLWQCSYGALHTVRIYLCLAEIFGCSWLSFQALGANLCRSVLGCGILRLHKKFTLSCARSQGVTSTAATNFLLRITPVLYHIFAISFIRFASVRHLRKLFLNSRIEGCA
jgi:hypothetical protein